MGNRKVTNEEFLERARAKHGDTYDYSKTLYVTSSKHVTLICKTHGEFPQTPSNHLAGNGCMRCRPTSPTKTTRDFVHAAVKRHGDRYSYEKTQYVSAHSKLTITCSIHGDFEQRANSHVNGSGCQQCSKTCGFKTSLPAFLYVLESHGVIKVGVTNRSVEKRADDITKSSGRKFEIVKPYALDGALALKVETKMLKLLASKYSNVTTKFDGSSECFFDVDLAWLLNTIEDYINEYKR